MSLGKLLLISYGLALFILGLLALAFPEWFRLDEIEGVRRLFG